MAGHDGLSIESIKGVFVWKFFGKNYFFIEKISFYIFV